MNITVAILAAGKGTRMNVPDLPKVLVPLNNKPLLGYVLETIENLNSSKTVVILGHEKEKVENYLNQNNFSNIKTVVQEPQLGTGHAVDQTKSELVNSNSDILILCGDVPLLTLDTLNQFIEYHDVNKSSLTVLSAITNNPYGYGRIIRDNNNNFARIVEQKDANELEKSVNEINSGTYIVKSELLFSALERVNNRNAQGEYYLTDIVEIIKNDGHKVMAYPTTNIDEIQGINSIDDLKLAEEKLNKLNREFNILGLQQIAIGSEDKTKHSYLWQSLFGLPKINEYRSETENVNEDILKIGKGIAEVEVDIMQPLDISKKPAVHSPTLNHIGLWVDDLEAAYKSLELSGVRFTPGGIRKGASGHDVCFIHPKGNEQSPVSGEGVLIELVQAPKELIEELK
ncbi:MAG: VOC family protein [Ignavibacteriae bacterium]|nr:VOC family protein [Ignavibacteriota bacterium]